MPISLLQAFKNHFNNTVLTGVTKDFAQIKLVFDCIDQYTYAKYGSGWNLGLYTQSITIKSSRTLQYYYDASIRNGREYETPLRTINEGHMSAHYSSPWAVAYQYQFSTVPYEEKLSWKVKTRTFMF